MTKQEEIFEGVESRIRLGIVDTTYETAAEVLLYLHSQGGVIKVGKKEPISCGHAQMTAARYSQDVTCPLIEAGYGAFVPLIKKAEDD